MKPSQTWNWKKIKFRLFNEGIRCRSVSQRYQLDGIFCSRISSIRFSLVTGFLFWFPYRFFVLVFAGKSSRSSNPTVRDSLRGAAAAAASSSASTSSASAKFAAPQSSPSSASAASSSSKSRRRAAGAAASPSASSLTSLSSMALSYPFFGNPLASLSALPAASSHLGAAAAAAAAEPGVDKKHRSARTHVSDPVLLLFDPYQE